MTTYLNEKPYATIVNVIVIIFVIIQLQVLPTFSANYNLIDVCHVEDTTAQI